MESMDRYAAATDSKSLQSCPTLCDPIDRSPPGSPVPGILQARTLEWVAISFSSAWKWKGKVKSLSCVWLLATPRTTAHQALPSGGFSRQEYWSGVPLPSLTKGPNSLQFHRSWGRWESCRKKVWSYQRLVYKVDRKMPTPQHKSTRWNGKCWCRSCSKLSRRSS